MRQFQYDLILYSIDALIALSLYLLLFISPEGKSFMRDVKEFFKRSDKDGGLE